MNKNFFIFIFVILVCGIILYHASEYKYSKQKQNFEYTIDSFHVQYNNLQLIHAVLEHKLKEHQLKDSIKLIEQQKLLNYHQELIKQQSKIIGSFNRFNNEQLDSLLEKGYEQDHTNH